MTTAEANVIAKKKAITSKLVTNEKLEMIIRILMIYGDNKRSIRLTRSFEKLVWNKYSLQTKPVTTIESQIYTIKKAAV